MAGHPVEERQALEKMRERFKNEDYPEKHSSRSCFALNDYIFYKYLRMAGFNVETATKNLCDLLNWRRVIRPEELTWADKSLIRETKFMGKTDKGHPIMYSEIRHWQPSAYTADSYLKSRVVEMEEARKDMARDGWKVDRIIVINDMRDFSLKQHCTFAGYQLSRVLMFFFGQAYAEGVETIYLLNCPLAFRGFWATVMKFTSSEVLSRIKFRNNLDELKRITPEWELYTELCVDILCLTWMGD